MRMEQISWSRKCEFQTCTSAALTSRPFFSAFSKAAPGLALRMAVIKPFTPVSVTFDESFGTLMALIVIPLVLNDNIHEQNP